MSAVCVDSVGTLTEITDLSVRVESSLWRVLGQQVEPDAGQQLAVAAAVLVEQLQLADAHRLLIPPRLHEEELPQSEHTTPAAADEAERLVEDVGAMLAARRADRLPGRSGQVRS